MDQYISQQKNQMLDSLENQVRFSQLVAVIVGEKGLGKTFLLRQLSERLDEEVIVASIDASLAMTDQQLEKSISLQLGLSWQASDISLAQRIQKDIVQKVLISVDDAHLLSTSCVNYLLDLNQQQLQFEESVLFILLAGEASLPSLVSQTDTYASHQEMCVVFQLEAIQQSETLMLVNALAVTNPDIKKAHYDNKKLDYFWQLSKGNPAELNYHITRWLDDKAPPEVVHISEEKPTSYLKGGLYLAIAVALLTLLIFQDDVNQLISGSADSTAALDKDTEKQTVEKSENQEKLAESELPSNRKSKNPELEGQNAEESESEKANSEKPIAKKPVSENAEDEIQNQQSGSKDNDESDSAVSENAEPEVESSEAEKTPATKDSAATGNSTNEEQSQASNDVGNNQQPNNQVAPLTNDEQTLLFMNGDGFAFQWVGLSELSAAVGFKNKHPLKSQLKIYRRRTAGKTLFLVVSAEFANRAEAERAQGQLPQQGISSKPWIKKIGAIQSEINQFQNAN